MRPRGPKGLRSADQRGLVRGMGGKMSGPHPLERRHRRHGQSVEPQEPRVEQLIKAAGAELRYLPPYSPDMNPIEKAYSKLKAFLRKIAERTDPGLLIAPPTPAPISSNPPNASITSRPADMIPVDRSPL